MGLLDAFSPKKKVESLLADKMVGPATEKAIEIIKEKGEGNTKEPLTAWVSDKIKESASSIIPEQLKSASKEIIDKAIENVVGQAVEQAKKNLHKT
jgi:hypothetical protein